jgi:hypothetical protein
MNGQDYFLWQVQKPFFYYFLLLPPTFPCHHQTVSENFFCKIIGHHWFPTKSDIAQFLYISFLVVVFILEGRSRHFEHIRCFFFFKTISSLLTAFMASLVSFFPTFYTFFCPSTTQNSELLENWRGEVLRRTILGLSVGGDITNTRKKRWPSANC